MRNFVRPLLLEQGLHKKYPRARSVLVMSRTTSYNFLYSSDCRPVRRSSISEMLLASEMWFACEPDARSHLKEGLESKNMFV
jgi:hypothetical protein